MELLHRRCCGLDVHKETVVACLRLVADGKVTTEVRTFQTITSDLLRLSEWLAANECTHIAVWHILDDGEFALVLVNAAHVKNVPGRKTDVNDAMWLAELLAHGLIRASFVPDTQTQEMRNLLRTRKQLVREQSSHVLRVQKTLEDANIKMDSVLSDLMGKSGRAMLEALIAGETNPTKLASLADRRVKASPQEFREALRGRVTKHHRFLLRLHLNQIDALDAAMATVDAQVEANLGPFRTAVELLMSIPGYQEPRRSRHRLRDRDRHEPVPVGCPSHLVGRHMSAQRRECRQAIGSATSVKPQAEANTRMLSGGATVYSKELIHTGDAGVADLRFHDNSNLSVGPKSSVRLDKFVYDPNKSAGSVAVEATRGSFRFVTGSQSKGSYQVKTPYGTLGIRG